MNKVIKNFEAEMKAKLMQKCPPNQGEEGFLAKCFKFFDIHNKGEVNIDQFYRTVEKIGVIIHQSIKNVQPNLIFGLCDVQLDLYCVLKVYIEKQDFERVFAHYDQNGNGQIDYKEFASMFCGDGTQRSQAAQSQRSYVSQSSRGAPVRGQKIDALELVKLFRDKIKSRGARGIIGLQKLFAIMDDDGSKSISLPEFQKACRDFKVGVSDDNFILFEEFDTNRDGTLNIDEFLMAIRGELNDIRRALVEKAFRKIDKDIGNQQRFISGFIDIDDIKDLYNASKHPDVIQGRKSEAQILMEFLETFEMHHNLKHQQDRDSRITLDEFLEYYTNISVSIDNDDYFALMMNNSWNLKGDAQTYKKYDKSWANEEPRGPAKEYRQPPVPVQRSGQASRDNPLVNTHDLYKPITSASRGNVSKMMYSNPPQEKEEVVRQNKQFQKQAQQNMPPRDQFQGGYQPQPTQGPSKQTSSSVVIQNTQPTPKFQSMQVERFRNKLKQRGGRGMIGLRRQFKIMDDNNSGTLDMYEFKKGIKDFQVDVSEQDIDSLFKAFDLNGNGDIDFDEFIRVVVGPMNQFRTQMVIKAFKKIDYNGDGVLTVADIKGKYDGSKHPDVKSGKKTEDEVLKEFLETFEMHHNVMNGSQSDGTVTLEEFIEYYTNISANIDNDAYFDLMMTNAWNIDGKNNTDNLAYAGSQRKVTQVSARDAWRQDHHRNLFGTDKETPFGKKKEQEWQTSTGGNFNEGALRQNPNMPIAGSSTFANPSDYKMQFMSTSQRHTGVTYSGVQHNDDDLVKMFRDKLASRGARGILGMQRVFKIMDDNNNGSLEIQEFWKAVCDFRIQISPEEARQLFDLFDINGDGNISYDELMRSVIGEMNGFRKQLVRRAFDKLDKNGNGLIELDDIKGVYNAKFHPEVKAGKKTEDEVLYEFLDTFELHHSIKNPKDKDRQINLKEFIEYYTNVSASIDNDQYFELMMTNAWNLNNVSHKKGWGAEV